MASPARLELVLELAWRGSPTLIELYRLPPPPSAAAQPRGAKKIEPHLFGVLAWLFPAQFKRLRYDRISSCLWGGWKGIFTAFLAIKGFTRLDVWEGECV